MTCRARGKGARRKVTCKVKLTRAVSTTLKWRLLRGKKKVRSGKAKAKSGKTKIRIPRAGKLRKGVHTLKITGRSGGVKIRLRT